MGRSPDMPSRQAILLKKQRGVCPWCCLSFREGDTLEVDHILATTSGGKDEYNNLQLLHGHCHDAKTALDMEFIRKNSRQKHLKAINLELVKHDWFWDKNDILVVSKSKDVGSPNDMGRYIE
jgi:RNA-directed DNA polymerase